MSGTTYEIDFLPGPILRGFHRGKEVSFRHVNYVYTELNQPPVKLKNQFAYFTGALVPRIHFYGVLPQEDEDPLDGEKTTVSRSPGFLDPAVMALVIDWKKFVA
ncbi:MAG: hypothetical protein JWO99_98 [Candidatus Saccharibacteria bacterium]|nr:hypothetical protein [Candidatus Saccharibacteria bacterium]